MQVMALAAVSRVQGEIDKAAGSDESRDSIMNLSAIAWALNFVDHLSSDLDSAIFELLMRLANRRDAILNSKVATQPVPKKAPAVPPLEVFIAEGADPEVPPTVVIDLPGICVVHKPPGWEVDSADVGTGILLSEFLQRHFGVQEAPLVHFEEHRFGMVHRLDRVSSGLLLIGKTFVGFHSLGWQLNTNRLEREYVVAVHGWVDPDLRLIDAKVLHVHAEGGRESRIDEQGKPSKTKLKMLGHCLCMTKSLCFK